MKASRFSKIVGCIGLLLVASQSWAGWKGNFLVGVEGAYGVRDGSAVLRAAESVAPFATATFNRNHSDNGYYWGLIGGYQLNCRNALVGLELKAAWQDFGNRKAFHLTDATMEHYLNHIEFERDTVWSLTARAGYKYLPWATPYVRFGVESADETVTLEVINLTRSTFLELKGARSIYRCVSGLGVEMPLWREAKMRFEYNYSSRGRGVNATGIMPVSVEVVSADMKVRQHSLLLDFIWNFDEVSYT